MSASERRIAELEQENRELRHLLSTHLRSEDLQMESGVSAKTGEPFMHMRWGDQAGQLSPEEARAHAVRIMDAAAAAEFDAALVKALTHELHLPYEKAVAFLGTIREHRGATDRASMHVTEPPKG